MKNYDAIVIGSGCGLNIVEEALSHGLKVALVDKGPPGGTCPNLGCIPSKILIHAADRIMEIKEARKLGITADIQNIDFNAIMERMRTSVRKAQKEIRHGLASAPKLDYYEGEGRFTGADTLEVNGHQIKGGKIFIAAGSRPLIPPLKGLEGVDYLTSDTVLGLKERPESLIIIGGGYVAVEYGHFFAAVGTKLTILEMADRLVLSEEPEISVLLKQELARRMDVHIGVQAEEVKRNRSNVKVVVKDTRTGQKKSSRRAMSWWRRGGSPMPTLWNRTRPG